jgi:hypothetical protein
MTMFLPTLPNLYTVEVRDRPVVVLSVDGDVSLSDDMLADPEIVKLMRDTRANFAKIEKEIGPQQFREAQELGEVDAALKTHLGAQLQVLEDAAQPGQPLWNGDFDNIYVRRSTEREAEIWRKSFFAAVEEDEEDPTETENWVTYLVNVVDPL